MIQIIPFGGCGLHMPLGMVSGLNREPIFFRDKMGFHRPPFALSGTALVQLLDFLDGKLDIPVWIRRLMDADPLHVPDAAHSAHVRKADIALIEMSTPIDYVFEDWLLNINRFEEVVFASLGTVNIEKKLVSGWRSAMMKSQDDKRREYAEQIAAQLPTDTEDQRNVIQFVRNTAAVTRTPDEMTAAIASARDRLELPVGMLAFNYQFMPDGRPISWPGSFKADAIEVARRLGIPIHDFAEYVQREGVANVMADDRRHWNKNYLYPLGVQHYDFAAGIVGAEPFLLSAGVDATADGLGAFGRTDEVMREVDGRPASATPVPPPPPKPVPIRRYLFDPASGGNMPADDNTTFAILLMGQGWALGANGDKEDEPVTPEAEYPGNAWMFDAGLSPRSRTVKRFTELAGGGSGSDRESPALGMADQILRNCKSRFGRMPQLLFATFAKSGTSLVGTGQSEDDGLSRGSRLYTEALYYMHRARDIAEAGGRQLEIAAVCLLQGEYEVSKKANPTDYRRALSQLQQDLDADLRKITGQAEPVRLLVTQTNRGTASVKTPDIAMAQLHVQDDNPRIRCAGPVYHVSPERRLEGLAMLAHAAGYRRVGQQLGRYFLDDVWGAHRTPLQVIDSYWVAPDVFHLRYPRPLALECDDSRIVISTLGPNLGLTFLDGSQHPPEITKVELVAGDELTIAVTLAAGPQGLHRRVLIAARRTGIGSIGRETGPRSGIRSRDPFDTDPRTGALYEWACTEEVKL